MTRAEYEALARRVETEEPSQDLDCAVMVAAKGRPLYPLGTAAYGSPIPPRYTTSLDAAASLVPEGAVWWNLYFERGWERGPARAEVSMFEGAPVTRRGFAASPAAALTAAALRAMAEELSSDAP